MPGLDLYYLLRSDAGDIASQDAAMMANAERLGLDAGDLSRLGFGDTARGDRTCLHAGHVIAREHVRMHQCAVCPRCLAAQPAIWADWEVRAQVVCPEHGCWLIDTCPRCRTPLRWRRRGLCTCSCGFELTGARTAQAPRRAVVLAAALRHRLFSDLSSAAAIDSSLPDFVWRSEVNELLGIFQLFRASGLRHFVECALEISNATSSLRMQAAVAEQVSRLLGAWPWRWRELLDELGSRDSKRADDATYRLTTWQEAVMPYQFLQRVVRTSAGDYPRELREELEAMLRTRRIFIGPRRYYVDRMLQEREVGVLGPMKFLWTPSAEARRAEADDRLSAAAVQDLFGATGHQMSVLCKVGILRAARLTSVRELDLAMARLAGRARSWRPSVDRDFVPLSEFSPYDGDELEGHLSDVMSGRTACVFRACERIPRLTNLFISSSFARSFSGRDRESTC